MEQIQIWVTEHLPLIISYAVIIGEAVGILLLKLAVNAIRYKLSSKSGLLEARISACQTQLETAEKQHKTDLEKVQEQYNSTVSELKKILISDPHIVASGKARKIAELLNIKKEDK